ncbi:MAG TPA: Fe-S cluster assembly protein SufD, partial [Xanthomonadaceae bacterium]|nr:Fe-S cluster assembly protein SufD [Xanthomonadaceae bacterium]
ALFYLRSRGIPEPQARRMLTAAFCHEPLRGIGDVALQAVLTRALDATMALDGDAQ